MYGVFRHSILINGGTSVNSWPCPSSIMSLSSPPLLSTFFSSSLHKIQFSLARSENSNLPHQGACALFLSGDAHSLGPMKKSERNGPRGYVWKLVIGAQEMNGRGSDKEEQNLQRTLGEMSAAWKFTECWRGPGQIMSKADRRKHQACQRHYPSLGSAADPWD